MKTYRPKYLIKKEEKREKELDVILKSKFSRENREELNFEPDYRALLFHQDEKEY